MLYTAFAELFVCLLGPKRARLTHAEACSIGLETGVKVLPVPILDHCRLSAEAKTWLNCILW